MTRTEIYYCFLKRFDNGKSFTKREALLWYTAKTENTVDYPFNGYTYQQIQDAWKLNSKGKIANPKGELKTYTEAGFNLIFGNMRALAKSAPMNKHKEEKTGSYVVAPDGSQEELLETYQVPKPPLNIDSRELIPAVWRRNIRHLTGKGNKGNWVVDPIQKVVTRKTVGDLTPMEDIEKAVNGKIKKAEKNLRQKEAAIDSGNIGDFHPMLVKLLKNTQKTEKGNLKIVQTVITGLKDSENETTLEDTKKELLEINTILRERDKKIEKLERKLDSLSN